MSTLRLWLCRLIGHTSYPGTEPSRCLVYHCPRCHRLINGGASAKH